MIRIRKSMEWLKKRQRELDLDISQLECEQIEMWVKITKLQNERQQCERDMQDIWEDEQKSTYGRRIKEHHG